MFRLTQYMRELAHPTPVRRRSGPVKPVGILSLIHISEPTRPY